MPNLKLMGPLLIKAICWAIWAKHNNCICTSVAIDVYCIICKIDLFLIAWINATPNLTRPHLEESIPLIMCNPMFVGTRIPKQLAPASEQTYPPFGASVIFKLLWLRHQARG